MQRIARFVLSSFMAAGFAWIPADRAHAAACNGGVLDVKPGSTFALGWTGIAYDDALPTGTSLGFEVLSRCSDDLSLCSQNSDCSNDDCDATCDCEGDATCEIGGPAGPRKCLTTMTDCVTSADCPLGVSCVTIAGPPLAVSSGGAPACIVRQIDGPWSGTLDATTGDLSASIGMRWRVFLGISIEKPCPSCGAPIDGPEIGDVFTCSGGPNDGDPCTVEGVTAEFGGTSSDCPPDLASNVTGAGLAIRFSELTTGSVSRTANLPCSNFPANPTVPGSNPKCTDMTGVGDPVCASNADCMRCTGDPSVVCTTNADCSGIGACAEAPDQPVTCGFWCHCGFCNNNPSFPCSGNADCPMGTTCYAGAGVGSQANSPQRQPNECHDDAFICGGAAEERCETTTIGSCADEPFRYCTSNDDCDVFSAGACNIVARPCFEPEITRTGAASAIGGHCRADRATCATNAECTAPGDVCVADSSAADTEAIFCSGASSSGAVNATVGITGPGTARTAGLLQLCRCDDLQPGCEALCTSLEPYCGDGVVEGLEACDGEPCCASDCTVAVAGATCRAATGDCDVSEVCTGASTACPADAYVADGTACDDGLFCTEDDECAAGQCDGALRDCGDANPCTTDSCDESANVCEWEEAPREAGSCLAAPKASLKISDSATAGKDKLSWKWTGGATFTQAVLGDPLGSTSYTVCVYDQAGGVPSLAAAFDIAPSMTLWLDKDPKGLVYKDSAGSSDGITKAQIKPGDAGKTRVKVSGAGASLVLPAPAGSLFFDQSPSVVVQLVNSNGTCWTSEFDSADTKRNESDAFNAQVK